MPLILVALIGLVSCNSDDDGGGGDDLPIPTANSKTFTLSSVAVPEISGTAVFTQNSDESTTILLTLENTPDGGMHPAHIHFNTAVEGGDIALTLGTVDGDTGIGTVTTSALDDGTDISYEELIAFDGYINVHLSAEELSTLVAQGDIGENQLTGARTTYDLGAVAVDDISGSVTFAERVNGEALATIALDNTPDGGMHPAHIHANTAAEGGAILFSFNPVVGGMGVSKTNVSALDDGTSFGYEDVLNVDGYVNVHLSADDLATLVAQGDIGQNDLTGEATTYDLAEVAVEGIEGSVTFSERLNGEALAVISLENTPDGGMHPAHIHANTAAEGGAILFSFNPVNGDTGISKTNLAQFDDESSFSYSDVLDIDGYVNVHLSADNLATLVAQGDIGQNDLTGEVKSFELAEVAVDGIEGDVTFSERVNGEALAVITLVNTPDGGMHPAHIHANTAAEGGAILFSFNPVNGDTGVSKTNVAQLDDATAFTYADVLVIDGYVNVHLSADDLGTLVAQGDIGENELTGESTTYQLNEKDVPGISGDATFFERVNGTALAVITLEGTPDGGMHPAHIHANDAETGGPIVFTFPPVNGTTGISKAQVEALDDDTAIDYSGILEFDGYINVHESADNLATLVAQGDIGSNI